MTAANHQSHGCSVSHTKVSSTHRGSLSTFWQQFLPPLHLIALDYSLSRNTKYRTKKTVATAALTFDVRLCEDGLWLIA